MDILKQLLGKFDNDSTSKLANFIGDPVEQVSKAVELSVGSLLNGLIHESKTNAGVEKVLKVIKDGGHSGDILDDLPGLLSNPDKTQLLITIGTNINNHFFESSISNVSDKVAQFSEVKKTSASSIVSFAAPLVLGFLGKQVKAQRLSPNSFGHYMREEESNVKGVLPPSLAAMFSSSTVVEKVETEKEVEEPKQVVSKVHHNKEGNSLGVLAWLLLGALVLAAAYYAFKDRIGISSISSNDGVVVVVDSLDTNSFGDSIDIEKAVSLSNESKEDQSFSLLGSSPNKNLEEKTSSQSKSENTAPKAKEREAVTKPRNTNTSQQSGGASSFKSYAPVVNQLGNAGSWAHFGANQFKRNSAELKNRNEIQKLANYLNQNPGQTLRISGMGQKRIIEDRAYAIREALYLKGVELNRMIIENGPKGDGGSVRVSTN